MTAAPCRRPALVVATTNCGKLGEFQVLLEGLGYEVRGLADYPGVRLPPEATTGYRDNARAKAQAALRATGAVALADDSGLEVDALAGGPGPASARYGGPGLGDAERVARLLAALGATSRRTARFRCAVALAAPWGEEALVEGLVEGFIAETPRGVGGFGYDPVFVVPAVGKTFAELTPAEKHRWSHRGRALEQARPILRRWLPRARGWTRSP